MLIIIPTHPISSLISGFTKTAVSAFILVLGLVLLSDTSIADSKTEKEADIEDRYERKKHQDHRDTEENEEDDDEHKPECKATKIDWDSVQVEPIVPVREKLLYVGTINQGDEKNPDMLLVIGTDPDNPAEYGKLIYRLDLPNIGDEVHHFGYNA
ncbi:MAG: selenium-binding protein SBP56-related protein, partial [Gammaproteobacteria bacterium]